MVLVNKGGGSAALVCRMSGVATRNFRTNFKLESYYMAFARAFETTWPVRRALDAM